MLFPVTAILARVQRGSAVLFAGWWGAGAGANLSVKTQHLQALAEA